jgi:hypothetical protein
MKKLSILMIFLLLAGVGFAQDSKEDKKAAKKAKKAAQAEQNLANTAMLVALFETKAFVLEANTLYDKSKKSYVLSSNYNFIGFDGKYSTIQLSFIGLVGWNGVGGVTADGKIVKMETTVKEGKPGFTCSASVQNKGGNFITMLFRVNADGSARVTMSGNFGEQLSFYGNIVPLAETTVYKGTTRF